MVNGYFEIHYSLFNIRRFRIFWQLGLTAMGRGVTQFYKRPFRAKLGNYFLVACFPDLGFRFSEGPEKGIWLVRKFGKMEGTFFA